MEPPPEQLQVSSANGNSSKLPLWLRVALVVLGIIFWLVVRSWLSPGPVSVSNVQEQLKLSAAWSSPRNGRAGSYPHRSRRRKTIEFLAEQRGSARDSATVLFEGSMTC